MRMEDEKYKEKDSEIPFETTPFIFTEYIKIVRDGKR